MSTKADVPDLGAPKTKRVLGMVLQTPVVAFKLFLTIH